MRKKSSTPNRSFKVADQIQRDLTELIAHCLATPGVHLIDCPVDYTDNDKILNREIKELSAAL